MEASNEVVVEESPTGAPAPATLAQSETPRAKKPAQKQKANRKSAGSPKKASHAERVESVLIELNDLLDEHEAELKEVKDRVQAALARSTTLRKAVKGAVKSVSSNVELEAELADYRKKFESMRNLMS